MILIEDKIQRVCELAGKHGVGRVTLFGSALTDPESAYDVDLGVEDAPPDRFWNFYGSLMDIFGDRFDLVDLDISCRFSDYVKRKGKVIYARP